MLFKTVINLQLKKHLLWKLLFLGALVFFIFILPQVLLTMESISLLLSLFPPEPATFGSEVIREVHVQNPDTKFFLFRPQQEEMRYPGIIISLGIHPLGAQEPNLQKMFYTLVKNNIVVLAVDSRNLKEALIAPEEVQNLVDGFTFLTKHPSVEPKQIGFVGLSVGSSLAFIAAADPLISKDVQYLLWMGGYYDVKELIVETLSKEYLNEGELKSWEPSGRIKDVVIKNLHFFAEKGESPEAKELISKMLEVQDRQQLEKLFDELPANIIAIMDAVSPKAVVTDMTAPLFALHGTKDTYIPFVHSKQLSVDFPSYKRLVLSLRYGHDAPREPVWHDAFSVEFWQIIFLTNEFLSRLR